MRAQLAALEWLGTPLLLGRQAAPLLDRTRRGPAPLHITLLNPAYPEQTPRLLDWLGWQPLEPGRLWRRGDLHLGVDRVFGPHPQHSSVLGQLARLDRCALTATGRLDFRGLSHTEARDLLHHLHGTRTRPEQVWDRTPWWSDDGEDVPAGLARLGELLKALPDPLLRALGPPRLREAWAPASLWWREVLVLDLESGRLCPPFQAEERLSHPARWEARVFVLLAPDSAQVWGVFADGTVQSHVCTSPAQATLTGHTLVALAQLEGLSVCLQVIDLRPPPPQPGPEAGAQAMPSPDGSGHQSPREVGQRRPGPAPAGFLSQNDPPPEVS